VTIANFSKLRSKEAESFIFKQTYESVFMLLQNKLALMLRFNQEDISISENEDIDKL